MTSPQWKLALIRLGCGACGFSRSRASGDRVGEISRLAVDLPAVWAQVHGHADVLLRRSEAFGWDAEIVGEREQHLLGFHWYDHVDKMLLDASGAEPPPDLSSGAWDDLEQGWWASIRVHGEDVYIAEADFDDLVNLAHAPTIAPQGPGVVAVDGVDVIWNRVPKAVYDRAWDRAIALSIERVRRIS